MENGNLRMEKIYDFDKIIERHDTGSLKYDALQQRYGDPSLLPLWVADMDFETPDFILDAMHRRLEHPILGYTVEPEDYRPAVTDWIRDRHGWEVRPEWLTFIPGVVKGIGFAVNVFLNPGEKVIIQPPVYHPFRIVPQANGREVAYNPLVKNPATGKYEMDFENLEKVADKDCRMLILGNPHNPGGITWDAATLRQLADFCHERGIIVISDEIHCDLTLFGNRHIPFASVSEKAAEISITFGAPTKTFNIAGVVSSYAIVPNPELRRRYFSWLEANELNEPHMLAPIATIAAFRHGEPWRRQLISYIEGNILAIEQYCKEKMPLIEVYRPQASYLVWLDCSRLNLSHAELLDFFTKEAGLALNDGEMFGTGGEGHMRLNAAAPKSVILKALGEMKRAYDNHVKS